MCFGSMGPPLQNEATLFVLSALLCRSAHWPDPSHPPPCVPNYFCEFSSSSSLTSHLTATVLCLLLLTFEPESQAPPAPERDRDDHL